MAHSLAVLSRTGAQRSYALCLRLLFSLPVSETSPRPGPWARAVLV